MASKEPVRVLVTGAAGIDLYVLDLVLSFLLLIFWLYEVSTELYFLLVDFTANYSDICSLSWCFASLDLVSVYLIWYDGIKYGSVLRVTLGVGNLKRSGFSYCSSESFFIDRVFLMFWFYFYFLCYDGFSDLKIWWSLSLEIHVCYEYCVWFS